MASKRKMAKRNLAARFAKGNFGMDSGGYGMTEEMEWMLMSPAQRFAESSRLWQIYLEWGGSFDPEPDYQSPFYFEELQCALPRHGRPGVHRLRRG